MFNINKSQNATTSKLMNEVITSIIGEDLNIEGNLSLKTSLRIDGKVKGNVAAEKLIIVGEKAEVTGDLSSKNIIIFGKLIGNVIAGEVQIKKTGFVNGDLSVEAIEIEMGGKYNGKLMMNGSQNNADKKPSQNTTVNNKVLIE